MSPPDGAADLRGLIDSACDVPPAPVDPFAAELNRLAALTPMAYEQERQAAAARFHVRVGALDSEVQSRRHQPPGTNADSGGGGRALTIPKIEPWHTAVDGVSVLNELAYTIQRHVVLDDAAADAVALWIVHTHAIDAASISPRLAITSPEKRCGKTTLLSVLSALVSRPLSAANITPATVFRAIEAVRPTLLVDEADSFFGPRDELRGIINAGQCRATAMVLRTVETREGYEVRTFSVWGPIALAAIGKLPGTIEDRSLKIALRRRRPDEKLERLQLDRLDRFKPTAQRVARWVLNNLPALGAADPDVPAGLNDRAADNWRPLFAVADAAGGEWPERARRAAIALSREGAEDAETTRTMLLSDLREMFAAEPGGVLFSREIVERLREMDERPWPEYQRDKPITQPQVAKLLNGLKILPGTVRRGGDTAKGYYAAQFEDAWQRYLPPRDAASLLPASTSSAGPLPPTAAGSREPDFNQDLTFAKLLVPRQASTPVTATGVTTDAGVSAVAIENASDAAACDVVTAENGLPWRERV